MPYRHPLDCDSCLNQSCMHWRYLYTLRDSNLCLVGFFNSKLKRHQATWLPCELAALCIGSAISRFAPYTIQSIQPACTGGNWQWPLCSYGILCRGEFSTTELPPSYQLWAAIRSALDMYLVLPIYDQILPSATLTSPSIITANCASVLLKQRRQLYVSWQWKSWLMVHHTCNSPAMLHGKPPS